MSSDEQAATGTGRAELTVIIPHFNALQGLERCLAALAAERDRSRHAFDVIVVDNDSAQHPERVCASYPFVRVGEETQPGPGPARNRGVRMAATNLFAFIDADCTAVPGWISTILEYFETYPDTDVIGGEVYIDHADPDQLTAIEAYESVFAYRMRRYYDRERFTGTGNMAVRRTAFEKVGPFAGISVAEDRDWGHRARALGLRIDFVPDMVIRTPARGNFAELARKWDRQIGHQFEEIDSLKGRLRWVLKALALAASPMVDAATILRSDRLSRLRDRALAFRVLIRIRLYRCRRMLGLLVGAGPSSLAAWRGQ
jgi:cellulose synthase/poly-beta-1,6-N-acetylglucosamine synthase-like glycosyltransferase